MLVSPYKVVISQPAHDELEPYLINFAIIWVYC
jgi:hypothetical protein